MCKQIDSQTFSKATDLDSAMSGKMNKPKKENVGGGDVFPLLKETKEI